MLPSEGPYVYLFKDGDRLKQFPIDTSSELVTATLQKSQSGVDTYFGLGSYAEKKFKDYRAAANVKALRSVWHDVDIGKEGAYATQAEVVDAVVKLVTDGVILCPTYFVSSGYGVHLYWCLDRDVTRAEWAQLAARTHRALLTDPLLCVDMTRVRDSASVLRLPGSYNFKDPSAPAPAQILRWHEIAHAPESFTEFYGDVNLDHHMPSVGVKFIPSLGLTSLPTAMVNNIDAMDYRTRVSEVSLEKTCAQYRHYKAHPEEQSYEIWFNGIGLCKNTDGGLEAAQAFSSGHPEYDPRAVEFKFKEWRGGWPSCEVIRAASPKPTLCEGCPFNNKSMSPLKASTLYDNYDAGPTEATPDSPTATAEEAEASDDGTHAESTEPPAPYILDATSTIVNRLIAEADGSTRWVQKRLFFFRLELIQITEDARTKEQFIKLIITSLQKGVIRSNECVLDVKLLHDKKRLGAALQEKGADVAPLSLNEMQTYLHEYVKHHRKVHGVDIQHNALGWVDRYSGFVLPTGMVRKGGTEEVLLGHDPEMLGRNLTKEGLVSEWARAVKPFINSDGLEPFALGLLSGFAAPLMQMTPHKGSVIEFWGSSGKGKSLTLKLGHSVFGKPLPNIIAQRDTDNFRTLAIAGYRHLMVPFDEVTNILPYKLSEFIYTVTDGRAKSTATREQQVNIRETDWSTIVVCTTNKPFSQILAQEKADASAENLRMIEIYMDEAKFRLPDQQVIDASFDILAVNHGVAGPAFIQYVFEHWDAVKALVKQYRDIFRNERTQEERYITDTMACVMAAASCLKPAGILDVDMSWLYNALRRTVPSPSKTADTGVAASKSTFERVLDEIRQETVAVYVRTGGAPMQLSTPEHARDINCRIEVGPGKDDCKVFLANSRYLEVCGRLGANRMQMEQHLTAMGVLGGGARKRLQLTKDTKLQDLSRTRCLEFDYTKMGSDRFHSLFDEAQARTSGLTQPGGNVVNMGR